MNKKCAYEKFCDKIPDYAKYLNTFGEMGFLRSIVNVKSNIGDRGMPCM